MDVLPIHAQLATVLTLYLTGLGIWGIALGARGPGPSPSYRSSLVIAEIAIVGQGLLGLPALLAAGPADPVHILYGLALVVVIPLVATIVREGSPRRTALSLGIACLFAAGLAIRGITTA